MKTLSRKLEMEGDNISKIPEKAATISHENQYPTDSILSRLVTKQTKRLYDAGGPDGMGGCGDQCPAPGAHTRHSHHTRRNLRPGCLAQAVTWSMGSKVQVWAPQSAGQRQGYCLLTVDMSWHYYRDKASWREYCPLCGSALWIFTGIEPLIRTRSNLVTE